jgi:hypothetical protein
VRELRLDGVEGDGVTAEREHRGAERETTEETEPMTKDHEPPPSV